MGVWGRGDVKYDATDKNNHSHFTGDKEKSRTDRASGRKAEADTVKTVQSLSGQRVAVFKTFGHQLPCKRKMPVLRPYAASG